MPSRRRPKSPSSSPSSQPADRAPSSGSSVDADLARFAAAVKEDEARKRADAERRAEAGRRARALEDAKAELDRAIAAVRRAKDTGKGRAEADQEWRQAKARVIELESGAAPSWATPLAGQPAPVDDPPDEPIDEPIDEPDDARE